MTRPLLLDGGLATHLESLGVSLDSPLWSGVALLEQPDLVRRGHADFARAGADILCTATYQCSAASLEAHGLELDAQRELFARSVDLVREAWNDSGRRGKTALSLGPYGATLADGSEYRGGYGLDVDRLTAFHRATWELARANDTDLVLVETVPDRAEVAAWAALADEIERPVWLSLSVQSDGAHLADGTDLRSLGDLLRASSLAAVGVNCCAPATATRALTTLASFGLPVFVYPNSGEVYEDRAWQGQAEEPAGHVADWLAHDPVAVGGCCRTSPAQIEAVRRRMDEVLERTGDEEA